ncbi:MAG: HdaA/DnaA family protein [Rickettsiales bacterium]
MSQIALPFAHATHFHEDMFVVSECNKQAYDWVKRWPDWNSHATIIYGATGCGKSHLGHIWSKQSDAITDAVDAENLANNALVENIEQHDETALFHLLNAAKENGFFLLLTASCSPKQLPYDLPDLTSRVLALPAIAINPPDDEVLIGAMRKQFSDRQLKVDDEVIAYLLPRMERSFSAIAQAVETLDKQALSEQRAVTIPFARKILQHQ